MSLRQNNLSDGLHWSDAARCGLLFCSICGKQIKSGCLMDKDGFVFCVDCGGV